VKGTYNSRNPYLRKKTINETGRKELWGEETKGYKSEKLWKEGEESEKEGKVEGLELKRNEKMKESRRGDDAQNSGRTQKGIPWESGQKNRSSGKKNTSPKGDSWEKGGLWNPNLGRFSTRKNKMLCEGKEVGAGPRWNDHLKGNAKENRPEKESRMGKESTSTTLIQRQRWNLGGAREGKLRVLGKGGAERKAKLKNWREKNEKELKAC